jgi:hypothetical protein
VDKEPLEEKLPISSFIRGTSNQTPVNEDTPDRAGNAAMIQALNRQVNRLQQEKRALREENESLLALTIHHKSDIEQLTDQVKHWKLARQNLTNVERAGLVNVKNHLEELRKELHAFVSNIGGEPPWGLLGKSKKEQFQELNTIMVLDKTIEGLENRLLEYSSPEQSSGHKVISKEDNSSGAERHFSWDGQSKRQRSNPNVDFVDRHSWTPRTRTGPPSSYIQ